MKKTYDIPSSTDSIRNDYELGLITIEEAAEQIFDCGFTNFIDVDRAREMMKLK